MLLIIRVGMTGSAAWVAFPFFLHSLLQGCEQLLELPHHRLEPLFHDKNKFTLEFV